MDRAKLRKILWWLAAVLVVGLLLFVVFGRKNQQPVNPGASTAETASETLTQGIFETETTPETQKTSEAETSSEPESKPEPAGSEETSSEKAGTDEAETTVEPSSEAETSGSQKEASSEQTEESTARTEPSSEKAETTTREPEITSIEAGVTVKKNGEYSDKEHVALYIHTYNKLPSNYISKKEAENLGWVSYKGNLWKVAYGKSIGGSYFGNYEGQLPKAKGRKYYECDIDFDGTFRNDKRIVYSNDGLIFYTEDHYETFERLY
ncbi:MAG: ribonuclease [Lachnospiraceae bacterium]|nr:ribonuclease [Lachnospiraceae bacterium]